MPRSAIQHDLYNIHAFLDANIILEGRPLADLPWHEIDSQGIILALVTPTAIKEIDSKKHDGRIGKIARAFNKLIAPAAINGTPVLIRDSTPRVELALANASRIPWDNYDDLDPTDGDSCIVAEAIHAKGLDNTNKVIVSHDIKPLTFAASHGITPFHVSDNWLRQTEPSRADRENQRLKQQISQYRAAEPIFEIAIEVEEQSPITITAIDDLLDHERIIIHDKILELNPPKTSQRDRYGFASSYERFDSSYQDKYEAYKNKLQIFMESYSSKVERTFNQTALKLRVANLGTVQAENLLIEVYVLNGWLHDRFIFFSPHGPSTPQLRTSIFDVEVPTLNSVIPPRVGRHEFEFRQAPNRSTTMSVTCEDFRHGQNWQFDGVIGIDAQDDSPVTIKVTATASNFHGSSETTKVIEKKREHLHLSKLINLGDLRVIAPMPIDRYLAEENYDAIDWLGSNDD